MNDEEQRATSPIPDRGRLTWDVAADAVQRNEISEFTIRRILAHGSLDQIRALRASIGDAPLRSYLERTRGLGLERRRLRFFETLLGLPEAKVRDWLADKRRQIWDRR